LARKTHFRAGRPENKKTRLFYFRLGILLPIQIQLSDIENLKNPKIDHPLFRYDCGSANFALSLAQRKNVHDFKWPTFFPLAYTRIQKWP
jgi:hypothetical protein